MKIKILAIMLCILLVNSAVAIGEAVIAGEFEFAVGSESVTLLKYVGNISDVIIPDNYSGLPLTTIGDKAFYGMEYIRSVDIPYTVKEIGDRAFYGCDGLSYLYIPNSVESIGVDTFLDCDNLLLSFEDGSYAQGYAMKMDLEYQYYDIEDVAVVESDTETP